MIGAVSKMAAKLLIKAWYSGLDFTEKDLEEMAFEHLFKKEPFELEGSLTLVFKDDKWYITDQEEIR